MSKAIECDFWMRLVTLHDVILVEKQNKKKLKQYECSTPVDLFSL